MTADNDRLIRLRIEVLIDPARNWPSGGPVRGACGMWEALLDEVDECQEYRILEADTVSGPGLAVWREQESLAAHNDAHWSTRVTPDPVAAPAVAPPAPAVAPPARSAGYTDRLCADCANALTVAEASDRERDGARDICGACILERRMVQGRIQSVEDGSLGLYDPVSGAYVDTTAPVRIGLNLDVTVRKIVVPRDWRQRRVGSVLLADLCDSDDEFGVTLHLEVAPIAAKHAAMGLQPDGLRDWYLRHGFADNPDLPGWLVRYPQRGDDPLGVGESYHDGDGNEYYGPPTRD